MVSKGCGRLQLRGACGLAYLAGSDRAIAVMSRRRPPPDALEPPEVSGVGLDWAETADGVIFAVSVVPRASRSRLAGYHGRALKVQLAAPPVDGAANLALIDVLAKALRVGKRDVTIVSGLQSRMKRVAVAGLSLEQLEARLR